MCGLYVKSRFDHSLVVCVRVRVGVIGYVQLVPIDYWILAAV